MSKASKFQIKLSGEWKDYDTDEDRIIKRAFLAGYPNASYKYPGFGRPSLSSVECPSSPATVGQGPR